MQPERPSSIESFTKILRGVNYHHILGIVGHHDFHREGKAVFLLRRLGKGHALRQNGVNHRLIIRVVGFRHSFRTCPEAVASVSKILGVFSVVFL